jgi:hypothetical protein
MPPKASGKCRLCPAIRRSLHRDHIIPLCAGGDDAAWNTQFICANCHEDKTRQDMRHREPPKWSENERALIGHAIRRSKRGQPVLGRVYKGRKSTPCSEEKKQAIRLKLAGKKLELTLEQRAARAETLRINRRPKVGESWEPGKWDRVTAKMKALDDSSRRDLPVETSLGELDRQ